MGTVIRLQNEVTFFGSCLCCSSQLDPYTIGQVASGYTHGGLITGVDYGNGVVSGVGAIGNRGVVYSGLHGVGVHHFGKREAEPWTVGQVAAGVPLVDAALDGRLHNPGVITHVSHGIHGETVWVTMARETPMLMPTPLDKSTLVSPFTTPMLQVIPITSESSPVSAMVTITESVMLRPSPTLWDKSMVASHSTTPMPPDTPIILDTSVT